IQYNLSDIKNYAIQKYFRNFIRQSLRNPILNIHLRVFIICIFKSKNGRIGYYGTVFSVEFQSDDSSTWKLPIGTALLTPIGQELMKICGSTPDIAYLNKFLNKINVEGSQVKLSIINM
ncbi:DUF2806 domain-containing protein, partial [Escherichia coli]